MPDINVIFHSRAEVLNMTDDQAREVIHAAADNLSNQLETFDYDGKRTFQFDFSDDGIDYADAATDHWTFLWDIWTQQFYLPGGLAESKEKMSDYLLNHPELATDGEFRYGIFSEELKKEVFGIDY